MFAVVLVGFVSLYNSRQATTALASQLRDEISSRIVEHVRLFLDTPHALNAINARAISDDPALADDPEALVQRFQEQIALFPSISSLNFGNTRGGLVNSGREIIDDSRHVIVTDNFEAGRFRKFRVTDQSSAQQEILSLPHFDARERPWYTDAVTAGEEVWSDIFTLFSGRNLAIADSRPVYAPNGDLLGVVSAELFLSRLDQFLQTLDMGTSGLAFILGPAGRVVATSVPAGKKSFSADEKRPDLRECSHPVIQQAARAMLGNSGETAREVRDLDFKMDGERYFLRITPLHDPHGIDWLTGVILPESDFMGRIEQSNRVNLGITGLAIALIVIAGSIMARRILSPIHSLSQSADELARGKNPRPLRSASRITEVNQLTASFNAMSEHLQQTVQGLNREIQDRIQTENELKESRDVLARLTRIIDASINIIFVTTSEGDIEYVNSTFEKITGYSRKEALGQNPRILSSGETTPDEYKVLWDTIKSGESWRGVFKNKKKDGGFYWANGFISPIRDEQGEITHFMAIQEDLTEKMASQQQLQYLAEHDHITGIINRVHFVELLDTMLEKMSDGQVSCLLQVDIDGFKLVNDAFGNSEGDRLLRELAEYLTEKIHQADMVHAIAQSSVVGRLSGDEFGILLPMRDQSQGLDTCEAIRKAVENTVFLDGRVRVTVSIGLVLIPEHGTESAELLAKGNAATATAKELGQNRSVLYTQGDAYLQQVQSNLEEKQRIIAALDADLFEPWFQPILHLGTGQIHHYEALARLVERDGTVFSPAAFIPTAERFGLIANIDRMISEKTMRFQALLRSQGHALSFSLNISGKNLGDPDTLSRIQKTIKETGADPEHIVFELTETAAIRNMKDAVTFVRALKAMGCKFSLDDFGVGFTSFIHLVEMEVDFLKIDGSFISGLSENPRNRILVQTIQDMAHGLGIQTIAEFVDSDETVRLLEAIGVDYAQGYHVGKPSPQLRGA
jgi:diguanylate cyclase (GGDEF)-like protein/PAS domain S-box-containing protein